MYFFAVVKLSNWSKYTRSWNELFYIVCSVFEILELIVLITKTPAIFKSYVNKLGLKWRISRFNGMIYIIVRISHFVTKMIKRSIFQTNFNVKWFYIYTSFKCCSIYFWKLIWKIVSMQIFNWMNEFLSIFHALAACS